MVDRTGIGEALGRDPTIVVVPHLHPLSRGRIFHDRPVVPPLSSDYALPPVLQRRIRPHAFATSAVDGTTPLVTRRNRSRIPGGYHPVDEIIALVQPPRRVFQDLLRLLPAPHRRSPVAPRPRDFVRSHRPGRRTFPGRPIDAVQHLPCDLPSCRSKIVLPFLPERIPDLQTIHH